MEEDNSGSSSSRINSRVVPVHLYSSSALLLRLLGVVLCGLQPGGRQFTYYSSPGISFGNKFSMPPPPLCDAGWLLLTTYHRSDPAAAAATPRRIEQRAGEPIWHDKYYAISQYSIRICLSIHFLIPHCTSKHGPASINTE